MTPDQGRALWRSVTGGAPHDDDANFILEKIVISVVMDLIQNKIANDDEFAIVIGRRIQMLERITHVGTP